MARSTPSARWVDAPVHSLYSSWGDYRAETFDRGPQRLKDISTVWTNEKEEKKKERRRRCWCWWLNRYPSWQPFLAHFIPNAHRIAYGSINDRILCPGCCPCSSGFKGNGREWKKAVHFCHVNLIYPYSFEYIYIYYRYIIWLPAHALLNSLASCWKERKKEKISSFHTTSAIQLIIASTMLTPFLWGSLFLSFFFSHSISIPVRNRLASLSNHSLLEISSTFTGPKEKSVFYNSHSVVARFADFQQILKWVRSQFSKGIVGCLRGSI